MKYWLTCALVAVLVLSAATTPVPEVSSGATTSTSGNRSALDGHMHDHSSHHAEGKALGEAAAALIEEAVSEENAGDVLDAEKDGERAEAVVNTLRHFLSDLRSELEQDEATNLLPGPLEVMPDSEENNDDEVYNIDKRVPEYKKRVPEYKKRVPEYKKRVPEYKKRVPEYKKRVPEYKKRVPEW